MDDPYSYLEFSSKTDILLLNTYTFSGFSEGTRIYFELDCFI